MKRWVSYGSAAIKQEEMIQDRLFNSAVNEEKNEESLDYIYQLIEKDIMDDYLVNGAILMCEKATKNSVEIDGETYRTTGNEESRLRVNHSTKVGKQSCAVITDCIRNKNIFSFGNCMLELSGEDKGKLKANPNAKVLGTCHCLMKPVEKWDVYPRFSRRIFTEDGIQALTMEAGLFCQRGAWILPVTSGQEDRYANSLADLTEEELEWWHKYELTLEEWEFAKEFGLEKEEQFAIFPEMREYFETYPELQTGNTIFAFEGVGDYTGGKNKYHPDGQFGAIFVYCKEGELNFLTTQASTLPDKANSATIKDGIYRNVYTNHKGYQALQLRLYEDKADGNIPAVRLDGRIEKPDTADGVNLHAAGMIGYDSTYSTACLTVKLSEYYEFGSAVGFLNEPVNGKEPEYYYNLPVEFPGDVTNIEYEGYIVVDRQFMPERDRDTFLNGI